MTEVNEESIPLNERTATTEDPGAQYVDEDPGEQFVDEGQEPPPVILQYGSDDHLSFRGLGKEEMIPYINDPFWKKMRLVLVIAFWIGWVIMLAAAIVIIILAPKCPYRPDLKWYDKETVYEIFPKSFQDSTPKDVKDGGGVGDIKGINARLGYLQKDAKNKVLYINSIYESNDKDHNKPVVDHLNIDPLFGTMEDFEELRKNTKRMGMRLIMDFIPNHTGKLSKWFLSSQKMEGKYSDYYIWAPCNPNDNTYPNNWMSVKGGRAWTYDDTRKECYYHQLESDKPDLNLWNSDVRQELESILRFWLDKGVDGFHVQNAQYLYEDRNLTDEVLTPGKTGNAYGDFEHNPTVNHPENAKILQSWKSVLETYNTKPGREKALIVTADGDLNTTMNYFAADVTIVRVNILSETGNSLAERIETQLRNVNFRRVGWMFSDKDSSRLASIGTPQLTKALLTLQATLPGVPFNYYGNEIGMTDSPTLDAPLKYRTPMQWNSKGTGFSQNTPWLERTNYTDVNVETEKAYGIGNDYTNLKTYTRLQNLRQKESFQWGKMRVFRDGDLLWYTREAEGFPGYLVAINFGSRMLTESFYKTINSTEVKIVFHSHESDNTGVSLSDSPYNLDPNHAVVVEYN